jgi:hypothetical protein
MTLTFKVTELMNTKPILHSKSYVRLYKTEHSEKHIRLPGGKAIGKHTRAMRVYHLCSSI